MKTELKKHVVGGCLVLMLFGSCNYENIRILHENIKLLADEINIEKIDSKVVSNFSQKEIISSLTTEIIFSDNDEHLLYAEGMHSTMQIKFHMPANLLYSEESHLALNHYNKNGNAIYYENIN